MLEVNEGFQEMAFFMGFSKTMFVPLNSTVQLHVSLTDERSSD